MYKSTDQDNKYKKKAKKLRIALWKVSAAADLEFLRFPTERKFSFSFVFSFGLGPLSLVFVSLTYSHPTSHVSRLTILRFDDSTLPRSTVSRSMSVSFHVR